MCEGMSIIRMVVVASSLAVAVGAPARGLDAADRVCQTAIADAGRQLLKRSAAILAACQRSVASGALPAGTDCLGDTATNQRRAAAAGPPLAHIQLACSDAQVAALAPAGDCAGARTVADLRACIRGSHDSEAAALDEHRRSGIDRRR